MMTVQGWASSLTLTIYLYYIKNEMGQIIWYWLPGQDPKQFDQGHRDQIPDNKDKNFLKKIGKI